LKPLAFDKNFVGRFDNVIILEEHSKLGGLGTILSERFALNGVKANLLKLGLPDQVNHELGSQNIYDIILNWTQRASWEKSSRC
jgi:transketolase C-terminal domain/subunit